MEHYGWACQIEAGKQGERHLPGIIFSPFEAVNKLVRRQLRRALIRRFEY